MAFGRIHRKHDEADSHSTPPVTRDAGTPGGEPPASFDGPQIKWAPVILPDSPLESGSVLIKGKNHPGFRGGFALSDALFLYIAGVYGAGPGAIHHRKRQFRFLRTAASASAYTDLAACAQVPLLYGHRLPPRRTSRKASEFRPLIQESARTQAADGRLKNLPCSFPREHRTAQQQAYHQIRLRLFFLKILWTVMGEIESVIFSSMRFPAGNLRVRLECPAGGEGRLCRF